MKTIRYNCFETNSSSTHAISVKKDINEIDHESIKPIIINNKKLVIVDVDDLDEKPHNDALTKLKYFVRWIIMKQNSMLYCYLKYKNKQEIEPLLALLNKYDLTTLGTIPKDPNLKENRVAKN